MLSHRVTVPLVSVYHILLTPSTETKIQRSHPHRSSEGIDIPSAKIKYKGTAENHPVLTSGMVNEEERGR